MFDWKIVVVFVGLATVLVSGIIGTQALTDNNNNGSSVIEFIGNAMSSFINTLKDVINLSNIGVTVNRNVDINGSFENNIPFRMDRTEVDSISILFDVDIDPSINIDDKRISVSEAEKRVMVSDFAGSLNIIEDNVSLEGTVNVFESGGVSFEDEDLSAEISGLYDELTIKNIEIDEIDLENSTGTINTPDGVTINTGKGHFTVKKFKGNITFYKDTFNIEGKTSRVTGGNNITTTINS